MFFFTYKVQEHTPLLSSKISTGSKNMCISIFSTDISEEKISAKLKFYKALAEKNPWKASRKFYHLLVTRELA